MWRRRPWCGRKGTAVGLRRCGAGLVSRGGEDREVLEGEAIEVLEGDTREVLEGDTRKVLEGEAREVLEGDTRKMLEGDTREVLEGDTGEEVLEGDTIVEMAPLLRKSGEEPGALGTSSPAILELHILVHSLKEG